ncbi:MAG: hypothetical protein Harvfovirus3_29 [Harvfovirus sp.]|uniref:Uncharacterized protein n=1 Tax=Harvfovirus sp. TaxID=2487768 RepID=A0A3G5A251_9VIRU|nr:MAG: hypothetical protein Harvfovirus3_29 [Harvfovirus sp.]
MLWVNFELVCSLGVKVDGETLKWQSVVFICVVRAIDKVNIFKKWELKYGTFRSVYPNWNVRVHPDDDLLRCEYIILRRENGI